MAARGGGVADFEGAALGTICEHTRGRRVDVVDEVALACPSGALRSRAGAPSPRAARRTRCNRLTRTSTLLRAARGVLAVTASNSAAMFVSADPATHDDLRAAVHATTEAIIKALASPGRARRSTRRELANAVAQLDPLPEDGAPLTQVARRPRARPRGRDSARGPELRRAPASRAADRGGGRRARGRRHEPVDGRVRRVAGGDVRGGRARHAARGAARVPGRVGRDDDGRDGVEPARAAARARPGGAERQARRAAAEPLADRGVGELARQHPPLGGAARARDRSGDRGAHHARGDDVGRRAARAHARTRT